VEDDVDEVGTRAKRFEEAHRLARDEAAEHGIARADEPRRGLET
jgi:hypothetical protein